MDSAISLIVGTAITDLSQLTRHTVIPTRMQKARCLGLSMAVKLYKEQQASKLYRRRPAVHKSVLSFFQIVHLVQCADRRLDINW